MMAQPWFSDPNLFGAWYGAVAGGVGGSLAGILGGFAGTLAPKGKGRTWILGAMKGMIGFGVLNLLAGLAALLAGQPRAIWYPMLLMGILYTLVLGINYPMIVRRYEEAEERRVQAEGIRKG